MQKQGVAGERGSQLEEGKGHGGGELIRTK